VAFIEGNETNIKDWIIIGAHHDHLGMGGRGSSSRAPDTIAVHNGADDNASGVAAVLEMAEYFAAKEHRPSKNMLFVTFGAEEKGLLGSKYFAENSPVDLNNVISMVNIDMLGRMKEDSSLQIGGIGTSDIARDLVNEANTSCNFNLALSEAGYGPSDHSSFYMKNIPVYFFSTGAHQDYHTPFDDADSLDYGAMEKGTRFIADIVEMIDKLEEPPEFREAGPKSGTARPYRNKITLGIMPDVSGESNEGMKVLAVTEGKPAYHGGMKKGDIITAIDGNRISSVYDYMYRLNNFKAGDKIIVTVTRNGKSIELLIQL
jgi:aminopeptidase-like protein